MVKLQGFRTSVIPTKFTTTPFVSNRFQADCLPALLNSRNQIFTPVSIFPRITAHAELTAACSTIELSRNLHHNHSSPQPHVESHLLGRNPADFWRDSTIELSRKIFYCTKNFRGCQDSYRGNGPTSPVFPKFYNRSGISNSPNCSGYLPYSRTRFTTKS
jgi:hypothetical protein